MIWKTLLIEGGNVYQENRFTGERRCIVFACPTMYQPLNFRLLRIHPITSEARPPWYVKALLWADRQIIGY